MAEMGLGRIPGTGYVWDGPVAGAYGRGREVSKGKDTTTGHWEIAGLTLHEPFPTYPDGFPPEVIATLSPHAFARKVNASEIPSHTPLCQRSGPRGL